MVVVDHYRCAYCGGCISVCPVGALTLEETYLAADDDCIECGDCVQSCPMGALSLPGTLAAGAGPSPQGRNGPTARRYDIVIAGAGLAGSIAAETAARAGLTVLLLEKRQEIGSPVRCAEGVGHEQLWEFVEPDPRWIAAEVTRASISAVAAGQRRTLNAEGGHGYILERRVFDRYLAERAASAGAEICVKTSVTGLLLDNGAVCGVKVRLAGPAGRPAECEIQARVVIAADGVEAQIGRQAGLDLQLPLADTMVCAQYLLAGVDIDPACTAYTISYELAPGGYLWVFPKGHGKANVGLGIQADLLPASDRPQGVLGHLQRFIESDPCLAQGYPVTLVAGNVPVALPPARIVAGGLLLAGDAARQVDPLTGGGIINAMTAGRLAARCAAEAIAAGDLSADRLGRYQDAWQASRGRKMARNYRLRERFAPAQRADERFLQAFALAAK